MEIKQKASPFPSLFFYVIGGSRRCVSLEIFSVLSTMYRIRFAWNRKQYALSGPPFLSTFGSPYICTYTWKKHGRITGKQLNKMQSDLCVCVCVRSQEGSVLDGARKHVVKNVFSFLNMLAGLCDNIKNRTFEALKHGTLEVVSSMDVGFLTLACSNINAPLYARCVCVCWCVCVCMCVRGRGSDNFQWERITHQSWNIRRGDASSSSNALRKRKDCSDLKPSWSLVLGRVCPKYWRERKSNTFRPFCKV